MSKPRVLFVCLGNICRSPIAEALFRKRAAEAGLDVEVDSAGTGDWHIGEPPQPGSRNLAEANDLDVSEARARQVRPDDFVDFTHIVAMDAQNVEDLKAYAPRGGGTAKVERLLYYSSAPDEDVLDPYGMGDDAFAHMYEQIESAVDGLIAELRQPH